MTRAILPVLTRARVTPERGLLATEIDVAVQRLDTYAPGAVPLLEPQLPARDIFVGALCFRAEAVADLAVERRKVELRADRLRELDTHVAADALDVESRLADELAVEVQVATRRAQPRAGRVAEIQVDVA